MVVGLHFIQGFETHLFMKGQRLWFHTSHLGGLELVCAGYFYGQMSKCEPPNASGTLPRLKGSGLCWDTSRHCLGPLPAFTLQQPREAPQQNNTKHREDATMLPHKVDRKSSKTHLPALCHPTPPFCTGTALGSSFTHRTTNSLQNDSFDSLASLVPPQGPPFCTGTALRPSLSLQQPWEAP